MKDLGKLRYLLGLKIVQFKKEILVNKKKYVLDLLRKTSMSGAKDITPMKVNLRLSSNECQLISNKSSYQRLIGKLIYLIAARPDITFALNKLSVFAESINDSCLSSPMNS